MTTRFTNLAVLPEYVAGPGGVADPTGAVASVDVQWDDATAPPRITGVRCTNPTAGAVFAQARSVAFPNRVYSTTFAAGTTTTLPIPTGGAARLDVTVDARGRLDGVEYEVRWA